MKKCAAVLTAAVLLVQLFAVAAFARSARAGDVSMNGDIEPEDARIVLRMAVLLDSYTAAQKKLADIDYNGRITPEDARIILRVTVGLEPTPRTMIVLTDQDLTTYVYSGGSGVAGQDSGGQNPSGTNNSGVSASVPAASAIPMPAASTQSGTFTFTSYGWGDGVGMSQYGAVGMAKAGYTCEQILKHYFTGVKLVKDTSYPAYTDFVDEYAKTEELVARIVYQEMYGIVDDNPAAGAEALKAQTIVIFTLLKYYNFDVYRAVSVGYATDRSYDSLPGDLKQYVKEVMGQYIAVASDASNKPIEALFYAIAAAKTASAKDVWGSEYSYLQSVNSPYDTTAARFSRTFCFSKDDMRQMIHDYDSSIELPSDPSQWIKIISHSASIDAQRGYVTKVQVGNRVLDGYSQFCDGLMEDYFWSSNFFGASTCFYVTYTP
ncbi:MAG: hypothetical protein IJK98_00860 [Clostridia bacterium]|nr:hypothetical protein [Clostridia bacterium]